MEQGMNQEPAPALCANGCGFFANPTTRDLCSKCYSDLLKQTFLLKLEPKPEPEPSNQVAAATAAIAIGNENSSTVKKGKNRCSSCKKRVGLLGFECKCGEVYCGSHRLPEMHSCTFDFKEAGRDVLAKSLFGAAECKSDKLDYRCK